MTDPAMERRQLTFLSWNLAMLERSAEAPAGWDMHMTEAAIRVRVLELAPDLVLYQELPGLVPFVETHDMVRANPKTHHGNLATLAKPDVLAIEPIVATVPGCAVLATLPALDVTIANVHLAPGPGASGERLDQLARVTEASPTERLVIIGDTNTRVDEVAALEGAGFNAPKPPRTTWDSRRNRFIADMPRFTAYFTRAFASPGVEIASQKVWSTPHTHDGTQFHLSDHFALSGTITWLADADNTDGFDGTRP